MIQTKTKVLIRDNSGPLEASCISGSARRRRKGAKVGHCVGASITKLRAGARGQKEGAKQRLQGVLIIHTKAGVSRGDGSTLEFSRNCGVSVIPKKGGAKKPYLLAFKRINTAVPLELRSQKRVQVFKAISSVTKLARRLL